MQNIVCRGGWRGSALIRPSRSQLMAQTTSSPSIIATALASSSSTPNRIWKQILETYDAAQTSNASSMTETNTELVSDGGIQFILKIATSLRDKPKAPTTKAAKKEWKNPFLPPEPDLFVRHLSSTHSLVLNKFNIVPHHVLVITQDFHPQEEPLNAADFDATWNVMQSMPHGGLAYFNCGPVSGASQPHKHLQIIPILEASSLPFWPWIAHVLDAIEPWSTGITMIPQIPFVHHIARLDEHTTTGDILQETYSKALAASLNTTSATSFNMIMSKDFMMVIPRENEGFGPISCNAMAFAGSFFVRSIEELDFIKAEGPLKILSQVGYKK